MIEVEEMYSETEVAEMLFEITGDDCPCNYSNVEEWLPEVCEIETCPHPANKLDCWKQFLKHRKEVKE